MSDSASELSNQRSLNIYDVYSIHTHRVIEEIFSKRFGGYSRFVKVYLNEKYKGPRYCKFEYIMDGCCSIRKIRNHNLLYNCSPADFDEIPNLDSWTKIYDYKDPYKCGLEVGGLLSHTNHSVFVEY